MQIDIQLNPAVEEWSSLRDGVLLAEDRGFDTAWVFDHFDGAMLGGTTMLECFALLGGLAACTDRIRLGTLVANVANRLPGVMAQSAASVQTMSGGRFTLGLGAGAAPASRWAGEHAALGVQLEGSMAERHRLVADTLDELERMWRPDRAPELATFALPSPPPNIILGVNSVALAELAGRRCDGINVRSTHPQLAELLAAAESARHVAGRADQPWDCSVWTTWDEALLDGDHPVRRGWTMLGVTRLILVCLAPHDPQALARAVPHHKPQRSRS